MATPGGTSARVCGICKSVIGDGKEDTLRIQCEGSCQLWAVVHRRCAGDESFLCVYCTRTARNPNSLRGKHALT